MPKPSGLRIEPRVNKATGKTNGFTITGYVAGVRIRRRAQSTQRALAAEEAKNLEAQLLREAWHGERRGARSFGEAILSYLEAAPRAAGDKKAAHPHSQSRRRCPVVGDRSNDDRPVSSIDAHTRGLARRGALRSHCADPRGAVACSPPRLVRSAELRDPAGGRRAHPLPAA